MTPAAAQRRAECDGRCGGRGSGVLPRDSPARLAADERCAVVRLGPAAARLQDVAAGSASWALDSGGFTELCPGVVGARANPRHYVAAFAATATRSGAWRGLRRRTGCVNRGSCPRPAAAARAPAADGRQLPPAARARARPAVRARPAGLAAGRLSDLRRPVRRGRRRPDRGQGGGAWLGLPPAGTGEALAIVEPSTPSGPAARVRLQGARAAHYGQRLASADSMAWSFAARRNRPARLPPQVLRELPSLRPGLAQRVVAASPATNRSPCSTGPGPTP